MNKIRFTKKQLSEVALSIDKQLDNLNMEQQVITDKLLQLKQEAQRFKIVMENSEGHLQQFNFMLKKLSDIRHILQANPEKGIKTLLKVQKSYERQKNNFLSSNLSMKILQEQARFESKIITALGSTLKKYYVAPSGKIYDLSNIPVEEYLNTKYSSKHQLIGSYSSSKISSLINTKQLPEINVETKATIIYQEALRRYEHTKRKGIFWKEKNGWQKVQSRGSIAETYAQIALKQNFQYSSNMEKNIGSFANYLLHNITNQKQAIGSDIQLSNIDIAIKTLDASTASIQQFKKMADLILTNEFSLEQLRKMRENEKGFRINAIESITEEELNKIFESFQFQ